MAEEDKLIETKGTPPEKKNVFFRALPELPFPPPPLLSGNLYIFFGCHKGIYKVYFLIRARPPPPLIRAMPERKHFFYMRCSLRGGIKKLKKHLKICENYVREHLI